MENKRRLGTEYEQIAGKYLVDLGYEIVCYNYRCKIGEIDIIAKQGETLVFVEVKYRKNANKGNPLEAVNIKKQRVISRCANYYIVGAHCYAISCRFDVIGIMGDEITHVVNAFEYQG